MFLFISIAINIATAGFSEHIFNDTSSSTLIIGHMVDLTTLEPSAFSPVITCEKALYVRQSVCSSIRYDKAIPILYGVCDCMLEQSLLTFTQVLTILTALKIAGKYRGYLCTPRFLLMFLECLSCAHTFFFFFAPCLCIAQLSSFASQFYLQLIFIF